MRAGFAMNKLIIIAFCVILVVVISAILIFNHDSGTGSQDQISGLNPIPAINTPLAVETDGGQEPAETEKPQPTPRGTVRIRAYTTFRELGNIIKKYAEEHWDFDCIVLDYTDAMVYSFLDIVEMAGENLKNNTEPMELFCVPASYMSLFTKGEFSQYVMPYEELGIDVEAAFKKMDIPQYIIDAGTNRDGKIVALPVYSSANVFMYRRSVAREVFGTDDPDRIAKIIGGGTQSWDKFLEAAQTLNEHGYYIAPGCSDLSYLIDTYCPVSDLLAENFRINPRWDEFMDISKLLYDNGCIKDTDTWSDQWYSDLQGEGDKVFGLVTTTDYCWLLDSWDFRFEKTYGDWAICLPPFQNPADPYSGIFVSRHAENKDLIKPLIEWITLDSSETGLQYRLANGTLFEGYNLSVISRNILKASDNNCGMLDGQDMNSVIYESLNKLDAISPPVAYEDVRYDFIFMEFINAAKAYAKGEKDKETAIADFTESARKKWKDGTRW